MVLTEWGKPAVNIPPIWRQIVETDRTVHWAWIHTESQVSTFVCLYVCISVCVCACMYMCLCTCMYVCACVCTCMCECVSYVDICSKEWISLVWKLISDGWNMMKTWTWNINAVTESQKEYYSRYINKKYTKQYFKFYSANSLYLLVAFERVSQLT